MLEPDVIEAVAPPQEAKPAAEKPKAISFRNSAAVRVGFLAGGIVSLLISLPMPVYVAAMWQFTLLLAGGFLSVYMYRRRTGESLNVRSGARMGWMTGVFCFVIMTVLFTVSIITIASGEGLSSFFRDIVSTRGTPDLVDQFNDILESPTGVASLLFGILLMFFVMLTLLPAVGGALGAKVLEKE
ncbi:MAG: hypothetical protein ACRD7E_27715 [Bryobacteraceae bacterium]